MIWTNVLRRNCSRPEGPHHWFVLLWCFELTAWQGTRCCLGGWGVWAEVASCSRTEDVDSETGPGPGRRLRRGDWVVARGAWTTWDTNHCQQISHTLNFHKLVSSTHCLPHAWKKQPKAESIMCLILSTEPNRVFDTPNHFITFIHGTDIESLLIIIVEISLGKQRGRPSMLASDFGINHAKLVKLNVKPRTWWIVKTSPNYNTI